jgi:hypothetical protein
MKLATSLSLLVIVSLTVIFSRHPHQNDFRSFYAGAIALTSGKLAGLYHAQLVSKTPLDLPFVRPPVYALILAPFSWLPFLPAFCLWIALQSGIFLYCLYKGQCRAACLFPPVILGICHGQDCAFFLGILVLSYVLLRDGRNFAGGSILGLGLLKFHLFLLWPVALAIERRWRALAGFCLAGAVLAALSLLVAGVQGTKDYCALLLSPALANSTPGLAREVGIEGLLANLGLSSSLQLPLCFVLAAIVLYAVRKATLDRLFMLLPAVSLAIAPHALYYDPTLLLLPFWLGLSSGLNRWFLYVLASPSVFLAPAFSAPWSALSAVALLAFIFTALASTTGTKPWTPPIATDVSRVEA